MRLFLNRFIVWPLVLLFISLVAIVYGAVDALFTFFATAWEVFEWPTFPQREKAEDPFFYLETPEFFDREDTPLEPEPEPVPQGHQFIMVNDKKIEVVVSAALRGYRVKALDNPSIMGQGVSVSQAKYDFYVSYKRWQAVRSLSGSYYSGEN
jgi:hypothetical protein